MYACAGFIYPCEHRVYAFTFIYFTHKKKDAVRARVFDVYGEVCGLLHFSNRAVCKASSHAAAFSRAAFAVSSCVCLLRTLQDQADKGSRYIYAYQSMRTHMFAFCDLNYMWCVICLSRKKAAGARSPSTHQARQDVHVCACCYTCYVAYACVHLRPRWRLAPAMQATYNIIICVFFLALPVSYGTF